MRDKCLQYTPLTVDLVEMDPGERFMFLEPTASKSFGVFYLSGYTDMIEGAVPGWRFDTVNGWRPNAENGWSNDVVGRADMLLEAPNGAKWICLSRNDTGEREIRHLLADGDVILPAGWGFVVATGTVYCDNKAADQLAYFRPREADLHVYGVGDLLLVR
ncbi:MAG: hypothetical protein K2Q27_01170 [Novosphingobium sp.]|nr:hypothetical protein [Novosphingobium sp.]